MTTVDILKYRLRNQGLIASSFKTPWEIVSWFGAMQSQDYPAATWALGLRLPNSHDVDIDQAFNDGKILRTHVMRPTWHFVSPTDIVWLLTLTAPRVKAITAYYNRTLGLDKTILEKANTLLQKNLQGKNYLTRSEITNLFKQNGIDGSGLRTGHILINAELERIICSGPRKGKQFTYALIAERAPHAKRLDKEEALAELTKRYFVSHGPATVKDFAWWSGLTVADSKKGLEFNKSILQHEIIDGKSYWFSSASHPAENISQTGFLLPNYDEYTIAYKEREVFLDLSNMQGLDARGNVIFNHSIVIDGMIVGGWRRILKKDSVVFTWKLFTNITTAEKHIVEKAAKNYGKFLGLPVIFE